MWKTLTILALMSLAVPAYADPPSEDTLGKACKDDFACHNSEICAKRPKTGKFECVTGCRPRKNGKRQDRCPAGYDCLSAKDFPGTWYRCRHEKTGEELVRPGARIACANK